MADGRLKKTREKKKQTSSGRPSRESGRLKASKDATPKTPQLPPSNSATNVPRARSIHKGLPGLPTVQEVPGEDESTQPEPSSYDVDVETVTQAILGVASETGDGASTMSDSSLDISGTITGGMGRQKDSPEVSEDDDESSHDEGM